MNFKIWLKERLSFYLPSLVVALIIIFLFFHFVDPAPPKHFVITTSEEDDNYYIYAKQYAEFIKTEGITLEVRPSKGAWENIFKLQDKKLGISAGFVQDGIGTREKFPDLQSLGSIAYEPIWIFYRKSSFNAKTPLTKLTSLKGKTIYLGERGGETHSMARKLLNMSGVTKDNAKFVEIPTDDEYEDFQKGKGDVAFFMAAPNNPIIQDLIDEPTLGLISLDQAEGIMRQLPYLHHLILPHGSINLEKNIPDTDIDIVSPTATLMVRKDIHPALVYLLLKAASKVHGKPDLFEKRHEFPTDKDFAFPLHTNAKSYYQTGTPFWLRYLPFWLATIVQRFIILVIPLAALIIPIIRAIPRFLKWRIRTRIYQRYGELKYLEGKIKPNSTPEEYQQYLEQLDKIEDRVNQMRMPLDFTDFAYSLRGHIQFVRDRLKLLAKT
jgi:TRAP transporter TAXI family solute receptor